MGAVARFSTSEVAVVPGSAVTLEVTVTNTGGVVDQFSLEPLGEPAPFITADPPVLSLFPGTSGTSTITIAPPRLPSVPAGLVPFAVRALSAEDPAGSAVEEGQVEIGQFDDASAELLPRTARARGRRFGRFDLAVDNRGNGLLNAAFLPVDPDQKLDFDLAPALVVQPGEAAFLKLKVRGRKGFLRGNPVTHSFQVVATGGAQPLTVNGSLLQDAAIPRWVPRALGAALVLAALLVGAWFALVKPAVKDTATDAAKQQTQAATQQASQAAKDAKDAKNTANDTAKKVSGGAPVVTPAASASPSRSPKTATTTLDPLGNPVFYRLAATGSDQSPAITFPAKQSFSLTDVLLQNPSGDSGTVSLLRGTEVLYATNLANFRDLDYHLVAPWELAPGQVLTMKVTCKTPGSGASCSPAVSFSGFTRPAPTATPTPGT